jgi:hypothetical protein
VSDIPISEAQQIISYTDIDNIILALRPEKFFSSDIKPLNAIKNICFLQCTDISLNRMRTRRAFSFSVFKQSFIDKNVSNRRNRNRAADIVSKK